MNEAASIPDPGRLRIVPVTYREATEFVRAWHRHHKTPPPGHKFSVGVATDDNVLRGVAIVGRPVARMADNGLTLEVTRDATDGYRNASSMLLRAAVRASFALGYRRVITYTQASESGGSLRAAGFHVVAELPPRAGWDMPSRPRDNSGYISVARTLWEVRQDA